MEMNDLKISMWSEEDKQIVKEQRLCQSERKNMGFVESQVAIFEHISQSHFWDIWYDYECWNVQ